MTSLQTLLLTPLVAALIARLLAKRPFQAAAVGMLTVGGLWLWLRQIEPADTAVVFWGQPMTLTEANQQLGLLLLGGLFILCALAIVLPSGDWFVPGGLAGVAFLLGAVLVRPFPVAVMLVLLAMNAFGFVVQSGKAGSVQGSLRYLLAGLLAVLLLLLINWQLEAVPTEWLMSSGQLLALALLLLLAGFPFHIWLLGMVNEAKPLPLLLVVGLVPIVPLAILFAWLAVHPNVLDGVLRQILLLGSSLTLLVAGVLAVTAVHLKRLIGGVLLLDMALTIFCFLLPESLGWQTAVTLQIGRFVGLLLVAVGWSLLERQQPDWPMESLPVGWGNRSPWGVALLGVGLFSLLGLPFTVGFVGHWRLLTAVAELANRGGLPWWLPAVGVLSLGLGAAGVLRLLAALLEKDEKEVIVSTDTRWLQISAAILLLLAVVLALFPQTYLPLQLSF